MEIFGQTKNVELLHILADMNNLEKEGLKYIVDEVRTTFPTCDIYLASMTKKNRSRTFISFGAKKIGASKAHGTVLRIYSRNGYHLSIAKTKTNQTSRLIDEIDSYERGLSSRRLLLSDIGERPRILKEFLHKAQKSNIFNEIVGFGNGNLPNSYLNNPTDSGHTSVTRPSTTIRQVLESEQKIDLYECRVLTPAFKAWMEKRNVGTELSFQAEHSMPSGGRADIIVTIDGKKYLCELKSFRDNNDAEQRFKVRQAIGQLLEYSSWEKPSEYHGHFLVVDEIPDKTLQKYLTNIASHFDQKFNCYYQDANGNFSPLLKHHQLPF